MDSSNTSRKRYNTLGKGTVGLLMALLTIAIGFLFIMGTVANGTTAPGLSPQTFTGTSLQQTKSNCFTLITHTLSYTSAGWLLNATLSIDDPAKVSEDEKFTASWKIASQKPPQILYPQITHEPPLTMHFYFDIENRMTVPEDEDQAVSDSTFWYNLFEEVILPPLQVDELEINTAKVYCNCTCEGRPPTLALPFGTEAQRTQIPNSVRNYMIKAVECSNEDKNAGHFQVPSLRYDENEANLWVIFRWRSEDESWLGKEDWTNADIAGWLTSITKRYYPVEDFIEGPRNRVLIIILGRAKKNERWNDFQEKIGELSRVYVGYLQAPAPSDSDKEFIKRHLTSLNVKIPVLLPLLLDEDQAEQAGLEIGYSEIGNSGCDPLPIPLDSSSGGSRKRPFCLTVLPYLVLFFFLATLGLGASLILYRYNPPLLGTRKRLKGLRVHFPWEEKKTVS